MNLYILAPPPASVNIQILFTISALLVWKNKEYRKSSKTWKKTCISYAQLQVQKTLPLLFCHWRVTLVETGILTMLEPGDRGNVYLFACFLTRTISIVGGGGIFLLYIFIMVAGSALVAALILPSSPAPTSQGLSCFLTCHTLILKIIRGGCSQRLVSSECSLSTLDSSLGLNLAHVIWVLTPPPKVFWPWDSKPATQSLRLGALTLFAIRAKFMASILPYTHTHTLQVVLHTYF